MFLCSFLKCFPNWRYVAQICDYFSYSFDYVLYIFFGVLFAKREAERSVCYLMRTTYSKQYVAWIKGA